MTPERVVIVPKESEERLVADDGRIEFNADGFGVIAEAVIGRVEFGAAGVADTGPEDASGRPEEALGEPKSGHCESGFGRNGRTRIR